ncbi:putative kinetochore protein Ndc80 [Helianthus anomalus]
MRGPAGRRPQATTPTPADPWQFSAVSRRDSDASFCSSRPSSTGANHHRNTAVAITDRSYQLHAVSTINSFLSTTNCQVSLKLKPLPSNSNIIETLKHVLKCLDYPVGQKLEDDLSAVLKGLNCPIKMNKSALKAPGTPHSFPNVLAVIHWLGDDDAVEKLDEDFLGKLQQVFLFLYFRSETTMLNVRSVLIMNVRRLLLQVLKRFCR